MTMYNDRDLAEWKRKADAYDSDRRFIRWIVVGVVVVLFAFIALIFAWKIVTPKLNLYRSNTEKQAVIKEQEAISEAAVFAAEKRVISAKADADARRIEAQGIADAQAIITATLTPEYLTWRYYEVLATTPSQVIYIPTEAGLPIQEAGRRPVPAEVAAP